MEWYVVHTVSGSEQRVKQMILDQIVRHSMSEFFGDIVVPIVEVPEIKRGKAIIASKKFMPGYIFIKMKMTNESRHLVKTIAKVTGFLGSNSTPQALTEKEIQNVFSGLEAETKGVIISKLYEIGTVVVVTDGPFETFTGIVEEVDQEKSKLRVSVSIFGKATPIELNFTQVQKKN